MLHVLDIFSGIGGFAHGFEQIGWNTLAFCETEPFCQRVLAKHWPNQPIFDDVRELNAAQLREKINTPVDVICGGFPCQDISVAGKQLGISGSRSGLWKEFARLIHELKPRYAVIENVANLRANGLATVIKDLWQIGYDAEWHCVPASALGAPHQRDRIWIIAYAHGKRCECDSRPHAGKDDPEGRTQCAAHAIACRDGAPTRQLSLYEAGLGEETERRALRAGKISLADSMQPRLEGFCRQHEEAEMQWASLIVAFRSRMLAIPTRAAQALLALKEFHEIELFLREQIHEALNELSRYEPERMPDADPKGGEAGGTATEPESESVGGSVPPVK